MKKTLLTTLVAACLVVPALGLDSPKKLTAPPPEAFAESDSIAIGVVQARPEDQGFQAFFRTAWQMLRKSPSTANSPFLSLVVKAMSSSQQDDVLLGFLPIQMVRVDRLDANGQPAHTVGVTIAGWPGLQSLFYNSLMNGPNGQAYPTKMVAGKAVVLTPKQGQKPEEARALARINGTFANFPNLEVARKVVPRLDGSVGTMPEGDLDDVLETVDRTKDTYGVLLNRKGSMMKFLVWLNDRDTARVVQAVGSDRMDNLMPHVAYLSWQGDLISDDQMNLTVRFQTDSPEAAEELSEVLKTARETLKEYGRAGDLQLATLDQQVMLNVAMVGYRKMLQDYLDNTTAAR